MLSFASNCNCKEVLEAEPENPKVLPSTVAREVANPIIQNISGH